MTRKLLLAGFFLFLAFAPGCSAENIAPARVTGSLKYKGQPLSSAILSFHAQDGELYGANINPDGTYLVPSAPVGELTVTVDTEPFNKDKKPEGKYGSRYADMNKDPRKPPTDAAPAREDKFVKIPAKYADKSKSPLKVTLNKGDNKFDIDLTD